MKRNWLISTVLAVLTFGLCISLQSCATNKINLRKTLDTTETVQVQAYWDPIADASLGLPDHSPKHAALFKNLSPAHPSQKYEVDAFKAFFPKRIRSCRTRVGTGYKRSPPVSPPVSSRCNRGDAHKPRRGIRHRDIWQTYSSDKGRVWSQKVPSHVYGHFRRLMPKSFSKSMRNSSWIRRRVPTSHPHNSLDG